MKIIIFCKSTKGYTIIIIVAVCALYMIAQLAFGKNEKPVKEAIQSVREPFETVYHGVMSNISSSKDKPEDIEDSKEYHFYSFDLFFKQTYEEAKLKRDKFNYEDRKKLKDLISNTRHTINNLIIQKDDKKGIEKEKNIFKKVEE